MKMVGLYLLIINTHFVHEESVELTVEPVVSTDVGGQVAATEGYSSSDKPSSNSARLRILVRMDGIGWVGRLVMGW